MAEDNNLSHDIWDKNKVGLGEGDKALWLEIESVITKVIEELRIRNKLRVNYNEDEKAAIYLLQENVRLISKNFNSILDMSLKINKEREKTERLQKALAEFGLDENSIYYLNIQIAVLNCIAHTEAAKVYFLYHLKDIKSYKPSRFVSIMERNAPLTWSQLKPYVDSDFRNSLAHGTWTILRDRVFLFKDASLLSPERLELFEFLKRIKSQNILYSALVNLIPQKFREYFNKY